MISVGGKLNPVAQKQRHMTGKVRKQSSLSDMREEPLRFPTSSEKNL